MSKILVTSNCQTGGIASGLKAMLPEYHIEPFPVTRLNAENELESLNSILSSEDIWVSINPKPANVPSSQYIKIPTIFFNAFHPDITYAQYADAQQANHLTQTHYNSFIAIWMYNNKVDPEDAARLYNHSTYKQLGYYGFWNASVDKLRRAFRDCDLTDKEFDRYMLTMKRRGLFMHSQNHPRIEAIIELCKLIAFRISASETLIHRDIVLPDVLSAIAVWPLYTEIGQELGLNGDYCWRFNDQEICGLQNYLAFAFREYREQGIEPGDLKSHVVIPNAEEILAKELEAK